LWQQIAETALALFARGQALARQAGLILVDTKYEMGLIDGQLHLIDEIHTPDSSRYWDAAAYERGQIENYDKEYLRKWYAAQGYRGDGAPPPMPDAFRAQVAARYMTAYERLIGTPFVPPAQPAAERIAANLAAWRQEERA
jgi:phosphoribosylaminoimidazole-succinocarboxamide synthase